MRTDDAIKQLSSGALTSLVEPETRYHRVVIRSPYTVYEYLVLTHYHVACRGTADQSWKPQSDISVCLIVSNTRRLWWVVPYPIGWRNFERHPARNIRSYRDHQHVRRSRMCQLVYLPIILVLPQLSRIIQVRLRHPVSLHRYLNINVQGLVFCEIMRIFQQIYRRYIFAIF